MKEREVRRYLEYLDAEPLRALGRTRRRFPPRKTFGLTAVAVVSAVLLGLLSLLSFSAFSGRLETAFWQEQTAQAALDDNLAPAGPLAPQDASPPPSPSCCWYHPPRASPCCMGCWAYIVQAFCAVPG
jgi:hypothetical protein